jgi:uncharacterized protein YijF (DUF1287 family)
MEEDTIKHVLFPVEMGQGKSKANRKSKKETNESNTSVNGEAPTSEAPKERKKKNISLTVDWTESNASQLTRDEQLHVLLHSDKESALAKIGLRQIAIKLSSYRSQDLHKGIFNSDKFVTLDSVVHALQESFLLCFYCRLPVQFFYEFRNDPRQWTLERIDNSMGHNVDNVEIACLECNIRRRTMYHERYSMTKQCVIQIMR